jgi:hypothetical protein
MDTQQFAQLIQQFMQQYSEQMKEYANYWTGWFPYILFSVAFFALAVTWFLMLISQHLKLTSTSSVLSQYHPQGSATHERLLYLAFWSNNFDLNHNNTDGETRSLIIHTLRDYERIGLLIRKGGVNRHLVVYLIGDVGIRLWIMLGQYIQEERKTRGDRFWHAGFKYLIMCSLHFHLKTSRGTVRIYHPDNRSQVEPYPPEKLAKILHDIEDEMIVMPGGLGMYLRDLLRIFTRRPFLFFKWAFGKMKPQKQELQ